MELMLTWSKPDSYCFYFVSDTMTFHLLSGQHSVIVSLYYNGSKTPSDLSSPVKTLTGLSPPPLRGGHFFNSKIEKSCPFLCGCLQERKVSQLAVKKKGSIIQTLISFVEQ